MVLAILIDQRQRRAVKRPCPEISNTGSSQTTTKFVARFSRKGHREHLVRLQFAARNSPLNSKGQDVRFSRAGACSHQEARRG